MIFILIIVFISVLHIPVNDAKAAYLVPKSITTQAGSSYTLMIKHDTAVPVECYVQNGPQKYSIDLFQSGISALPIPSNFYSIQPKADDSDTITSLGYGICGFKVDSVSESINWNLSFVDQAKNTYYANAGTDVKPTYSRHVVQYEKIGDTISINCGNEYNFLSGMLYCKLFDPQNRRITIGPTSRDCRHSIPRSDLSNFGVWKCSIAFEFSMMLTEITYEFIPKGVDIAYTWVNETDNHVNIGCSISNTATVVDYCVMVRPDGMEIIVNQGLAIERYAAIDTNLAQHVCAMQIAKPLEASEKGLWRCEQYDTSSDISPNEDDAMGGLINVSVESSLYKKEVKLPVNVFAHINSTLAMRCEVPFSSPYCYMRGPDGFMYPVNNSRRTSFGVCDFVKDKAQITDNGTWVCVFGRQTGEPEAVYKFEVHIPEPGPIKPEIQEIELKTAGTAPRV